MKHDNDCLSNDNIFVSQRRTYAKHWSIPLVDSSKCNGHSISLCCSDSAVMGKGMGGESTWKLCPLPACFVFREASY